MGTANVADASAQPRRTGIGDGGTSLRAIESGDGGDGDSPTIRMFLIELWPNRLPLVSRGQVKHLLRGPFRSGVHKSPLIGRASC